MCDAHLDFIRETQRLEDMFFSPPPPMIMRDDDDGNSPVLWTRKEDKLFEDSLVRYSEDTPERWSRIASLLPGKTPRDVSEHYRVLIQDVMDIEAGRVAVPGYNDDGSVYCYHHCDAAELADSPTGRGRKGKEERKKGVPWTEEEHRRFLDGLERFGKGDWRSISRNAVVTRTPTQVASHAQKYFIRLNNSGKKDKKRGSIHDITTKSSS